MRKGFIGIVEADERNEGQECWDDLSGKKRDAGLVEMARKQELEEFSKHGFDEKVPIKECWERAGKRPIGVRWVDVNGGDEVHPEIGFNGYATAAELPPETPTSTGPCLP